MLKDLTSIGDINIREYIRSKEERIVRKEIKNNNYLRLHKKIGQYFADFGGS